MSTNMRDRRHFQNFLVSTYGDFLKANFVWHVLTKIMLSLLKKKKNIKFSSKCFQQFSASFLIFLEYQNFQLLVCLKFLTTQVSQCLSNQSLLFLSVTQTLLLITLVVCSNKNCDCQVQFSFQLSLHSKLCYVNPELRVVYTCTSMVRVSSTKLPVFRFA